MATEAGVARERAGGGITVLVLDRAAIEAFNLPGGMTWNWANTFVARVEDLARLSLVPGHGFRSGELSRSLGHSATPTVHGVVASVRATARHAIFYHNGTAEQGLGYIYAHEPIIRDAKGRRLSGGMYLPRHLGYRSRFEDAVHGQRAHPFLAEAMEKVFDAKVRV